MLTGAVNGFKALARWEWGTFAHSRSGGVGMGAGTGEGVSASSREDEANDGMMPRIEYGAPRRWLGEEDGRGIKGTWARKYDGWKSVK